MGAFLRQNSRGVAASPWSRQCRRSASMASECKCAISASIATGSVEGRRIDYAPGSAKVSEVPLVTIRKTRSLFAFSYIARIWLVETFLSSNPTSPAIQSVFLRMFLFRRGTGANTGRFARNYGGSVSRRERRPCPRGLSPWANFGISFSGDAALGRLNRQKRIEQEDAKSFDRRA
jgi:hypothetical protein